MVSKYITTMVVISILSVILCSAWFLSMFRINNKGKLIGTSAFIGGLFNLSLWCLVIGLFSAPEQVSLEYYNKSSEVTSTTRPGNKFKTYYITVSYNEAKRMEDLYKKADMSLSGIGKLAMFKNSNGTVDVPLGSIKTLAELVKSYDIDVNMFPMSKNVITSFMKNGKEGYCVSR